MITRRKLITAAASGLGAENLVQAADAHSEEKA